MPDDILEEIRILLPKYLTPSEASELFDSLRSYPEIESHYLPLGSATAGVWQGDGWPGFVLIDFDSLERKSVTALVISNSCDIDPQNVEPSHRRILFSPLIRLSRYVDMLRESGIGEERVEEILRDIRRQAVTDVYYLPNAPYGPDESIVLLDNINTNPLDRFLETERSLLFRLNQVAWYVLLIKLSIHFSRANEGVKRFPLHPEPHDETD